jgi:hypothetical protein
VAEEDLVAVEADMEAVEDQMVGMEDVMASEKEEVILFKPFFIWKYLKLRSVLKIAKSLLRFSGLPKIHKPYTIG